MFRSLLASLCLAAAGFLPPLHGLEPFRPEPVNWSGSQDDPIVFGDTWVAYREGQAAVNIADRATGQILKTLERPADDTPVVGVPNQWRTVSQWGKRILHSGNRLAVVANAQIRNVPPGVSGYGRNVITVFLWDLPSATPAGILDIDLDAWNPFAALSSTRLVVLDQQQRRFLQWDPVALTPLPAITVPAEFPAPVSGDGISPSPIAMGENTVVFRKTGYGEPLDLVAVNLASGGTTRLPLPANRVLTGRIAMGTGNDALLVASFGSGGSNTPGKLDLLHYDLGTGMLIEASSLEHSTLSANDVRVLVQPDGDGGWSPAPTGFTASNSFPATI